MNDKGNWIAFTSIYDKEQNTEIMNCPLPDNDEEILVTDGIKVWLDTFCFDEKECYLDCSNRMLGDEITHWMRLPHPPN